MSANNNSPTKKITKNKSTKAGGKKTSSNRLVIMWYSMYNKLLCGTVVVCFAEHAEYYSHNYIEGCYESPI